MTILLAAEANNGSTSNGDKKVVNLRMTSSSSTSNSASKQVKKPSQEVMDNNRLSEQHRNAINQLVTRACLSDDFWSYYKAGRGRLTVPLVANSSASNNKLPFSRNNRPLSSICTESTAAVATYLSEIETVNQFLIFLNALRLFSFFPLASQLESVVMPDHCIRVSPSGTLRRRGELQLCIGISRIRLPVVTLSSGGGINTVGQDNRQWIRCCRFKPSSPSSSTKNNATTATTPCEESAPGRPTTKLTTGNKRRLVMVPPNVTSGGTDEQTQPLLTIDCCNNAPSAVLSGGGDESKNCPLLTRVPGDPPSMMLIDNDDDDGKSNKKMRRRKMSFFRNLFSCFCCTSSDEQVNRNTKESSSSKKKYLVPTVTTTKPSSDHDDSNSKKEASNGEDTKTKKAKKKTNSLDESITTSTSNNDDECCNNGEYDYLLHGANSLDLSSSPNPQQPRCGSSSTTRQLQLPIDTTLLQAVHDHFVKACLHDCLTDLSQFVETQIGALFLDASNKSPLSSCFDDCCGLVTTSGPNATSPSHVAVSICFTAERQLTKLERCLNDRSFLTAVKSFVFPFIYQQRPTSSSSASSSSYLSTGTNSNSNSGVLPPAPISPLSSNGDSCHVKTPETLLILPGSSAASSPVPPSQLSCGMVELTSNDVELFVVIRQSLLKSVLADLKPPSSTSSTMLRNEPISSNDASCSATSPKTVTSTAA